MKYLIANGDDFDARKFVTKILSHALAPAGV